MTKATRNKTKYWSELLTSIKTRGVDEALGAVFFQNQPLNRWLRETLSAEGPNAEFPLLGESLFEAVFPWKASGKATADLVKAGILSQRTVDAGEVRAPYSHQYEAYKTLLTDPHSSVVISSGTGSGKTECFMVPIIESIVREIEAHANNRGIRALFLYPLNALIANQKKRFDRFTEPFDGAIRYALYTGELQEDAPKGRYGSNPAELTSRNAMRKEIPHLLVTNPTMLEYMLLRKVDRPLVLETRKNRSFKWIVLDEAHTYLGSSAAEMALLLRRVLNAFGVDPNDVHFIATSATVDASDKEKLRRFLIDISGADPKNVHVILGERDVPAVIPTASLEDGDSLESLLTLADVSSDEALVERLKQSRTAMTLRNAFIQEGYKKLGDIERVIGGDRLAALEWLDLLSKPLCKRRDRPEPFLPLRLQQMMATTDTFLVCPNPDCTAKTGALLDPAWRFGAVWLDGRQNCTCGAPLFPLAACSKCSSVALAADLLVEEDGRETLVRPGSERISAEKWSEYELRGTAADLMDETGLADDEAQGAVRDDIAEQNRVESRELEAEEKAEKAAVAPPRDDFDDSARPSTAWSRADRIRKQAAADAGAEAVLAADALARAENRTVESVLITNDPDGAIPNELSWQLGGKTVTKAVNYIETEDNRFICPGCHDKLPFSAFYMRRISERYLHPLMPLILDYGGTPKPEYIGMRPMDGRKLLSFTDSRQGTAKSAALIEQLGEKSLLASMLFAQANAESIPKLAPDNEKIKEQIALAQDSALREAPEDPMLRKLLEDPALRKFIEKACWNTLTSSETGETGVHWDKFAEQLENEIVKSPHTYRRLCESFHIADRKVEPKEIAEILLLREFGARPVNGATLETCGLIRLEYHQLSRDLPPPAAWPLKKDAWRSYLKTVLDFFVRLNRCIKMPEAWRQFGGNSRVFAHRIKPLKRKEDFFQSVEWPNYKPGRKNSRIVNFTAKLLGLDPDGTLARSEIERINDVLEAAYRALTDPAHPILTADRSPTSPGFYLDLSKNVTFVVNRSAWRFKGINKLFDTIVSDTTDDNATDAICPTHVHVRGAVRVDIPLPPKLEDMPDRLSERQAVRRFLATSTEFRALVDTGCWNSSGSFAYEQANYFSAAEHTAQLDKTDRKNHEANFEDGSINVLASSTTMEMGIDLGDIGAVVLNGVPPHPSNYLQRIGRAGRRNESRINSFTVCRSGARDRNVFKHPEWALREKQPELTVSLSSPVIVERHVTAEVLGRYLHETKIHDGNITVKQWLEEQHPAFEDWVKNHLEHPNEEFVQRICRLVRYSALEHRSFAEHMRAAFDSVDRFAKKERIEIDGYNRRIDTATSEPEKKALKVRLEHIASKEILKRLTECLVLPSSIRVVNTVQLERLFEREIKKTASGSKDRNAGVTTRDGRNGIFEYAPEASSVIDSTNYRTSGLRISWVAGSDDNKLAQSGVRKQEYACLSCGETFLVELSVKHPTCPTCGSDRTNFKHAAMLPDGFVVAEKSQATKDPVTTTYVKEAPSVLIDAPWVSINDDKVRTRSSTQARIISLNHARQPRKSWYGGFAVCLACGFAKSMPESTDEKVNWRHRPVNPTAPGLTSENGWCKGPDSGYLFREGVTLASEWLTDGLQISFYLPVTLFQDPKAPNPDILRKKRIESAGIGICVALRRAVAELYGIDEDEMSFAHCLRKFDKQERLIVSVYDCAMAGYTSGAIRSVDRLLGRAQEILNCPGNCETACGACILSFDSQKHGVELDRHDALKLFEANDVRSIAEGITLKGIVGKARPISSALCDYLEGARLSRDASRIILFARQKPEGDLSLATTDIYNLARRLAETRSHGRSYAETNGNEKSALMLAAVGFDWQSLDQSQQNRLAYLADYGVQFVRIDPPAADSAFFKQLVAATDETSGTDKAIETPHIRGFFLTGNNEELSSAAAVWATEGNNLRIVTGLLKEKLPALVPQDAPVYETLAVDTVRENLSGVARAVSFGGLSIFEFGRRFIEESVRALDPDAERIDELVESPVVSVEYTDNYLERAGDAALVLSIFNAVAHSAEAEKAQFVVRTGVPTNRRPFGYGLPANLYRTWNDEEQRRSVFSRLEALAQSSADAGARFRPMNLNFEVADRPLAVHHRQLLIRFRNGESLEIFADQGVGCVEFVSRARGFVSVSALANHLFTLVFADNGGSVTLRDAKSHTTHLSVSRLKPESFEETPS